MCLSVNNCCCCFTLSVGAKIISIVSTLQSAAFLVIFGTALLGYEDLPIGRLFFYAGMAVTALMQFAFGCLLIVGAFWKRPALTWPWTLVTWFQSVALLILTVIGTVLLNYNRKVETTAEISTVISAYFVYALILYYFASVVHSRRQQMVIECRTFRAKRMMGHRVLPNYYV